MKLTLGTIIEIIIAGAIGGVVITAIVFAVKDSYEKDGLSKDAVFKKTCLVMIGVCILWQALTSGLL